MWKGCSRENIGWTIYWYERKTPFNETSFICDYVNERSSCLLLIYQLLSLNYLFEIRISKYLKILTSQYFLVRSPPPHLKSQISRTLILLVDSRTPFPLHINHENNISFNIPYECWARYRVQFSDILHTTFLINHLRSEISQSIKWH